MTLLRTDGMQDGGAGTLGRDDSQGESRGHVPSFVCRHSTVLALFLLALTLRLGYAFFIEVPVVVDAKAYHRIAINLMEGFGYIESREIPFLKDQAIARNSPLYPAFLAAIFRLSGPSPPVIWVIQSVLGACTVVLIFRLASRLFEKEAGLVAAALAAAGFDLVILPSMLLTETLYLFLVSLSLLSFFWALDGDSPVRHFTAGLLMGAATLTRPVFVVFLPLLFAWMLGRRLWRPLLLCGVGAVLVIAPWSIRNTAAYGQFIPLTVGGGYVFWVGNNPDADGELTLPPAFQEFWAANPAYKVDRQGYAEGLRFIMGHPASYIRLLAVKSVKSWSLLRTNGWYLHMRGRWQWLWVMLSAITEGIVFTIGLLGIATSSEGRQAHRTCLLLYAASCILTLLLTVVEPKYRLTIFPALLVFAGKGAHDLWATRGASTAARRYVLSRLLAAAAFIGSVTVIDIALSFEELLRRVTILRG